MTSVSAVFRRVLPVVVLAGAVYAAENARVRAAGQAQAQATPTIGVVLQAVADYLAQYERDILAIGAEEEYSQQFAAPVTGARGALRTLKSEMLLLGSEKVGILTFRDVYEVDGKPIRDRNERLSRLFAKSSMDALEDARAISEESARFNLNISGVSTNRTLNVPMAALMYLRGPFQNRSTFALERVANNRGRRVASLAFEEHALPRLIGSPTNLAMRGRALVELPAGRVLETTLIYTLTGRAGKTEAEIAVTYGEEPTSKLLMPLTMKETYAVGLDGVLTTTARYSKFHRFSVDAETSFGTSK